MQPALEVVGAGEPQPGQRIGQPVQVEAVGGVGHRLAGEFGQPVGVGVQQGVLGVEIRPAHAGTGGLPGEEGAVVAPAQFGHHQGPHVAAEGRTGPGQHGPAGVDGGEARGGGGRRRGGRWRIRRFGRQGDATPGARVQPGLAAGRQIAQRAAGGGADEAAAAALRQQRQAVDEDQAQAADQDPRAGRDGRQRVRIGGPGADPGQAVRCGGGEGVRMALGEHHPVGEEGRLAGVEDHLLAAPPARYRPGGRAPQIDHSRPVDEEPHRGGPLAGDGLEEVPQIAALVAAGGVGAVVQRGVEPAGGGGAGARRPCARHALVGVHRDLLGGGVHPQQTGLVGAPGTARAGWVRVDDVQVQGPVAVQGGDVGEDPLDDRGAARTAADETHGAGRAHRVVHLASVQRPCSGEWWFGSAVTPGMTVKCRRPSRTGARHAQGPGGPCRSRGPPGAVSAAAADRGAEGLGVTLAGTSRP